MEQVTREMGRYITTSSFLGSSLPVFLGGSLPVNGVGFFVWRNSLVTSVRLITAIPNVFNVFIVNASVKGTDTVWYIEVY